MARLFQVVSLRPLFRDGSQVRHEITLANSPAKCTQPFCGVLYLAVGEMFSGPTRGFNNWVALPIWGTAPRLQVFERRSDQIAGTRARTD